MPIDPCDLFAMNNKTNEVENGFSSATSLTSEKKDKWSKGVEFLMSCIAMSVGLGNIWRFPFTAYENGGGAFLIPYIIVLFLIGKPIYFMEMVLGQFSSKGAVKVYDFVPALRGTGVGQTVALSLLMTYYAALLAIVLYYGFASFSATLPWSVCQEDWPQCYASGEMPNSTDLTSSSELYFSRVVVKRLPNIDNGIGLPGWELTICLLCVWLAAFFVVLKGVKSTGKASYFLAIFPYSVLFILLIRAVTLPGALQGILFFIKPDFYKILEPKVWYEAVTQCFFSINVCFGIVIVYSSFNSFSRDIYRDALIVTSLDTVTCLLAGFTIFGVLGNLAHESGKNVSDVVQKGAGLAFISYPEAISKFQGSFLPQFFSVVFFLMLFVLGIGTIVAIVSSIVTVIREKYPMLLQWHAVLIVALIGFCCGLVYVTPGGLFILDLVDHHGASFIVYILGIAQVIGVAWIYGLRNFCDDIEFMLNRKLGLYWRICWVFVTPVILIVIMIYNLANLKQLDINGIAYPIIAIVCGWMLSALGILQVPFYIGISIFKQREYGLKEAIKIAVSPKTTWGPEDKQLKREWLNFKERKYLERQERRESKWRKIYNDFLGY